MISILELKSCKTRPIEPLKKLKKDGQMTIDKILSYIGTLGIGGIIGVIFIYIFDYNINKRKLLFEADIKKRYQNLYGNINFRPIGFEAYVDNL